MSLEARKPGVIAAVVVALALLALVPGTARATFPGRPGLIVFNLTFHGEDHSTFTGGLYAIRPGQKHPHQLTNDPLDYDPSFDPTGRRLVFRHISPPPSDDSATGLYTLDLRNGAVTRLTRGQSDTQPSFGPNGMVVFSRFSSASGSYDLFLSNRAGHLLQLTSDTEADEDPVFSPDGKRIIFTQVEKHAVALRRNPGGQQLERPYSICSVRIDGSNPRTLARLEEASNLDISPDGRNLVFHVFGGGPAWRFASEVWTKPLAGVKPSLVSRDAWYPTYSPAGDKIAYTNYSGLWTRNTSHRSHRRLLLKTEYLPMKGEGELLVDPTWQPVP